MQQNIAIFVSNRNLDTQQNVTIHSADSNFNPNKPKIISHVLNNMTNVNNQYDAIVSNAGDCGRLGDQLLNYIKARYFAYIHNVPFKLKPFPHCEFFMLHDNETIVTSLKQGSAVLIEEKKINSSAVAHYDISYFCTNPDWSDPLDISTWENVLNDELFMTYMKNAISLKDPLILNLPKNSINVAVHVRKAVMPYDKPVLSQQFYDMQKLIPESCQNSTYQCPNLPLGNKICTKYASKLADDASMHSFIPDDKNFSDVNYPDKFLPDQYYIDQIRRIRALFPEDHLNIHLFTNDENPEKLCAIYKNILNDPNMTIACATSHYESRIANDMIAMAHYDCLIRSKSNFAQIADFIGDHQIVISPTSFKWYKNKEGLCYLTAPTLLIKEKTPDGSFHKKTITMLDAL